MNDNSPLFPAVPLLSRGKIRELYSIAEGRYVLIVATDRLSAFDVVFNERVPAKGEWLTRISKFWFQELRGVFPNHWVADQDTRMERVLKTDGLRDPDGRVAFEQYQAIAKRSTLAHYAQPLRMEAIVRRHLDGSAWAEYRSGQSVGGIHLPAGLRQYDRLPQPIFTPTTKAKLGGQDRPLTRQQSQKLLGDRIVEQVEQASRLLFERAERLMLNQYRLTLCDTKFEFGLDRSGNLMVIDEIFTPDSSRLWRKEDYDRGVIDPLDKQYLRVWLKRRRFDGKAPIPLPQSLLAGLESRYREVAERLGA